MSRSPEDEKSIMQMQDPDSAFRINLDRVNQMIADGGSLSGHERNCAFLNTRSGKFASIFAVSGLDFDDDSRSPAVADWDNDGDLDLWVTNRTAPQVRFLRNDSATSNHFLMLQLQGTQSNRDAIGARVEIEIDGEKPLVKTLQAGHGFLSQSSKTLHFGLGASTKIKQVVIKWPSGGEETLSGIEVDKSYRIVEGAGKAVAVERVKPAKTLTPEKLSAPKMFEHPRVVLSARLPLPPLRFRSDSGETRDIPNNGKPVLINLWASWCAPCLAELNEWTEREQELRSEGLRVYAISIDDLDSNPTTSGDTARKLLQKMRFPFDSGLADEVIREQLHQSYRWPYSRNLNMPVPTSFLLDPEGRLAIIYRGKIEMEQLLKDAKWVQDKKSDTMVAALPFAGRWQSQPSPKLPIRAAVEMMDDNNLLDAAAFFESNRSLLWKHPEFALLAVWIGDEFSKIGQLDRAITFYQDAVNRDPTNLTVINNLAWQFASNPDPRIHNPTQGLIWAEKANGITNGNHPSVLSTLAVAYAAVGRFDEAITASTKAKQLAIKASMNDLANKMDERIKLFRQKKPYFQ